MKNTNSFLSRFAFSAQNSRRKQAKVNDQKSYEALEARRVMAILIGSSPDYDGVFDPGATTGGTSIGDFPDPSTGDGNVAPVPSINGSLGDVDAPSELTDRFKLPELGRWPDAPSVSGVDLDELDGEPDGLSLEKLPDNHVQPTVDLSGITDRNIARITEIQAVYDSDKALADSIYESAIASATSARTNALNSAIAKRDATISGYTAEDVQALRDVLTSAETAYHSEVSRVNQQETEWLSAETQRLSEIFSNAAEAAREQYNELAEAAREVFEDEFENADTDEARDAAQRRLNSKLSGYQKTRDDTIINAETSYTVNQADARKASEHRKADAGKTEFAALQTAKQNLVAGMNAAAKGTEKNTGLAQREYAKDQENAQKDFRDNKSRAEAAKSKAYLEADAKQRKAVAVENARYFIEIEDAYLNAYADTGTEVSKFYLARAQADHRSGVATFEANKDKTVSLINGRLALDIATIDAALASALKESTAFNEKKIALNVAVGEFADGILDRLETAKNEKSAAANDVETQTKGFQRKLDKDLATVANTRVTRLAEELKQNRKDLAFVGNQRHHGLISQETYQQRSSALHTAAEAIRKQIQVETFETEGNSREEYVTNINETQKAITKNRGAIEKVSVEQGSMLAKAQEGKFGDAENEEQEKILAARVSAQNGLRPQLQLWAETAADANTLHQQTIAGIVATHQIDLAQAGADFHVNAANNYAQAVRTFADANPDNPWAQQRASELEAIAQWTSTVAVGFVEYSTTTANGDKASALALAPQINQVVLAKTQAETQANEEIWTAIENSRALTKQADDANQETISTQISSYDELVASANKTFFDVEADAKHDRTLAFFGAALGRMQQNMLGENYVSKITEAIAAKDYVGSVVPAHQTRNLTLADKRKAVHDSLVTARKSAQDLNTQAAEIFRKGLSSADAGLAKKTATANNVFAKAIARESAKQQAANVGAISKYAKVRTLAQKSLSIAQAEASTDFGIAIAQMRLDAAYDKLLTDDSLDDAEQIAAQYDIEVYDAELTWQQDFATPYIEAITQSSEQIRKFSNAAIDAAKSAQLSTITAEKDFTVGLLDDQLSIANSYADEGLTRDHGFADAATTLANAAATASVTFSNSYADGRLPLEKIIINESTAAEIDRASVNFNFYLDLIDSETRQTQMSEISDNFMSHVHTGQIAFAQALADAAEIWGIDRADLEFENTSSKLGHDKKRINDIAEKTKTVKLSISQSMVGRDTIIQNASHSSISDFQQASASFSVAITGINKILTAAAGQLSIAYSTTVATAETVHHIAIAQLTVDGAQAEHDQWQTLSTRINLDVAEARVDYLTAVSPSYIQTRIDLASYETNISNDAAEIELDFVTRQSAAELEFQQLTSGAVLTRSLEILNYSGDNEQTEAVDYRKFITNSIAADYKRQLDRATVYQQAGKGYVSAEASLYRSGSFGVAIGMMGISMPMDVDYDDSAAQSALQHYTEGIADYRFLVEETQIKTTETYKHDIADAQHLHVVELGSFYLSTGTLSAQQQQIFENAITNAVHNYQSKVAQAISDAEIEMAKASRDTTIAETQTIAEAVKTQYREIKHVMDHLASVYFTNTSIRQAAAYTAGAWKYIRELVPDYVTAQTDAANENVEFVTNASHSFKTNSIDYSKAERDALLDAAETRKKHSVALVAKWVETAVEHSQSQQTYDKAVATAVKTYDLAIAGLRYDARVAGGGAHTANKDLSLDQPAVDAASSAKTASLQQASTTKEQSTATTLADHLATIRSQNRNRDFDFAVFGRDWRIKNVNINNRWSNAIANFEHDARNDYIDIQHDFRLDDLQAYLDGLEAMYNRYSSADNLSAWQALRDARVSEIQRINDQRAVAHAENLTERDDQIDENNEKKTTGLTQAQDEYDRRAAEIESTYQANLNAGPWTGYQAPNISYYDVETLNMVAREHSYVSLGQHRVALVDQLRGNHAIDEVNQVSTFLEVGGYSGQMFDRIGATSMSDLMRYTGNYVDTNIRGTIRSLDSSGGLEFAYNKLAQAAEIRWAWQLGIAQGFVNGLNAIQDAIIGLPNLAIGAVNTISYGTSWVVNGHGYQEGDWRVPYIPSPDWSKDLIVHEGGSGWTDSHAWSKGLIGTGVEIVSGQWLGKINLLGKLNKLDDVSTATRAANVLDDGVRAANNVTSKAGNVGKVADKAADVAGPNGLLHARNFRRAADGISTHSPSEATRRLQSMAKLENGISVDVQVVSPSKWRYKGSAGVTGIRNGKVVVRIKNGPLDRISGVMRHEMVHVWQHIRQPMLTKWATSNLAPGSSIGRFLVELPAHRVHTFFNSPVEGALRSVLANPSQWVSDGFFIGLAGWGGYEIVDWMLGGDNNPGDD